MKIAFNPSTVAALITPPNNKDITFDLRGRNIFARGVKFLGTDTWRDIKINNVSIGSNTLDLRNGSNTTLTNTNGVVTINSTWRPVVDNLTSDSTTSSLSAKQGKVLKSLIDGKSNSGHTHDDRYLKLTGGTMASNALITFADSGSWGTDKGPQGARGGLYWTGQSDYAKLYAEETVGDNLDLVIQFGDDNSNGLSIRNKANTQTSYISAGGVITTGTFKGNLDWSYITNKPTTATRWPSWAEVTGKPSSFTPSTHTHGLSNSVFFLNMPNISGNAKWKEVFGYPVNYNLLLSVRINSPAPEWCVGNYGSGILYGGSDTKGFMSSAYNEPLIMWAGGNGSSDDSVPKWYIGIKGIHKSIYNLATIASEANAAYNLRHSHSNKSVLDGITSTLVNNWNVAYTFVNTITGTDTDKVINKWDEIVNFLAGITEDNKLNTLLNSKLSVYKLADNTNVGAIKNNGIYYSTSDASSGTLVNSPFNTGFTLINMTSLDNGDDLRRSRLVFNAYGEIKVSDDRDLANTAETWYNVLTSKNSGINGSTIKLNGTSITVYSSSTADGRYVKKSGDTMSGALNFANNTWNKVGDDSYVGDCNVSGHFGIKAANTTYPGIAFFNNANAHLGNLTAYNGNIKYGAYSLRFLDNGNTSVGASTWTNPFSGYNSNAVADGQAICVWGQSSSLSNLAADSGDMSLWLKRVNAKTATLNMVLDGEYYANGNLRLAHISEIPTALKNPHALTISLNGTSQGPYDGSAAKNINITPSSIGASPSSHTHAYLPLSGGTMTGNIKYIGKGTSYIGNGENDAANGVGGALNNLVISSWLGVSFTTSCSGLTYTNKNAVSINCRNGYVYANTFVGTFNGNASTATKLTSSAGNAALPIYFSDGKPVACTASLIFSNLSNSGNNLSITVAGQNRTLIVGYANNADTVDGEHASNFSYTHQTSFDFSKSKSGRIVTFDQSDTDYGWINGFASTHSNYLTSIIFNTHRSSNWYVGYIEGNTSTGKTNGLLAVHKLAFVDLIPTSLKNPYSLTLKANGTTLAVYDGSSAKEANFTYTNVGAASASHTHTWTSITDKLVAGNEFNIVNAGFNADIWFNYKPINDSSKTASIHTYIMGNGAKGMASVTASGFIKNGSNSNYVLLGDGGHKAISSLSVNYANSAGNADTVDGTHLNGIFTAFGNNAHNITATIGGVTKSFLVNWAADSDKLDGYHENSFLRYRETTSIDLENTLWDLIGIKLYNGALPDNLTNVYNYGSVISLPCTSTRFEIYASELASLGNGLYYRSGWRDTKRPWLKFIDSSNIGSQSVNYANSAGNADKLDGIHANGLLTALSNSNNGISITVGGTTKSVSNISVNYASSAGSVAWDNVTGKPSTFAPSAHTHKWADITDHITKLSLLTNDTGFVTGSVSGKTITINGSSTTWSDTWRPITDDYKLGESGTSLSSLGSLTLYNDLLDRIPNLTDYYWANVKISTSSSTTTSPTVHTLTATRVCAGYNPEIDNSISCSNWFRSSGATGWYNATYLGGWYMSDTSWIRAHNGVGIYTSGQIYSSSSIRMGNIYLLNTNEINSASGIHLNYQNSGNISLCYGGGKVGIGTTSPTYKLDVNGDIHSSGTINCNSLNVDSTLNIKDSVISCSAGNISILSKESGSLLINSREVLRYDSDFIYMNNRIDLLHGLCFRTSTLDTTYSIYTTDDVTVLIGVLRDNASFKFRPAKDGLLLFLKIGKLYSDTYFWCTAENCVVVGAKNFGIYLDKNQNKDCFGDGLARIFIYIEASNRWYEFYCG